MNETPIRIAIADDEPGMRLIMRKIIAKAQGFELVFEAENGEELLKLYDEQRPDVVILDVEMPELTGVECAKIIQDKNPRTLLIFATAHEKYMGDAFEVYAFDYLLKPFKIDRALRTLERAHARLTEPPRETPPPNIQPKEAPSRLMVKHKDGVSFVDMNEILLAQREERSTVLYCLNDARFVTNIPLGDLEAKLPDSTFFRSHKSYIVNISHIDSITPYGRWTYIIKLRGTKCDALITHERFEELQRMFD